MRILQKLHDALRSGADGPPALPPLSADHMTPVPIRTRMGTPADVALVLDARAARLGLGAAWRDSLADLLALLDIDGAPPERAELAEDLNLDLRGADSETAEARLHAALLQRLAENDALAPQDFYK